MMVVYRIGAFIPVPNIDVTELQRQMFAGGGAGVFDFLDLFAGGALRNFTVFAMSITPYITASIIIQLLTGVVPYFEELQKQGPEGRKKMTQYTRYGTIVLALIQAVSITFYINRFPEVVTASGFFDLLLIVIALTAGTAFLMWLGEQITEKGVGNGISIIIFAGIVSNLPIGATIVYQTFLHSNPQLVTGVIAALALIALLVLIIVFIIYITEAERRVQVQYAKRVVGRKMYGGQSTHIPIKINSSGVLPIIFAMSLLQFPQVLTGLIAPNA